MTSITSIEALIDCFEQAQPTQQVGVLKRMDIAPAEFEHYSSWAAADYTRNCIARNDDFEFILICWDAGAKTPLHGHQGQDCWMCHISGVVSEQRFDRTADGFKLTNETLLSQGRLTYMHDKMGYHTIENRSGQRAMTLHVYAKPIDHCRVFNSKKDCFETKTLTYDTVSDLSAQQSAG